MEIQMDAVRIRDALQSLLHRVKPGLFLGFRTIVGKADNDIGTGDPSLLGNGRLGCSFRAHLVGNLAGRHFVFFCLVDGVPSRDEASLKVGNPGINAHIDAAVGRVDGAGPVHAAWAQAARSRFRLCKPGD